MKRYVLPLFIMVLIICATGVWYFGLHRPNKELRNAESERICKTTPTMPEKPIQNQQSTEIPTTTEVSKNKASGDVKNDVKPEKVDTEPMTNIVENEQKGSNENVTPSLEQEASKPSHKHEESETSKQLKKEVETALIEGAALLANAYTQMVTQLQSKPVSEQVAMLNKIKAMMTTARHPITGDPLFDNEEEANTVWHKFYDGLISTGYTPPPGFEK